MQSFIAGRIPVSHVTNLPLSAPQKVSFQPDPVVQPVPHLRNPHGGNECSGGDEVGRVPSESFCSFPLCPAVRADVSAGVHTASQLVVTL